MNRSEDCRVESDISSSDTELEMEIGRFSFESGSVGSARFRCKRRSWRSGGCTCRAESRSCDTSAVGSFRNNFRVSSSVIVDLEVDKSIISSSRSGIECTSVYLFMIMIGLGKARKGSRASENEPLDQIPLPRRKRRPWVDLPLCRRELP